MYIFLRSTRRLCLALGLGGVWGPARIPQGVSTSVSTSLPGACSAVPVRTKTQETTCAPAALHADGTGGLGKGRGKCLFCLSPSPMQGCPVADVTVTGSVCWDGDAARHTQPWWLLSSGVNRKPLSILVFLFYCYWKSALACSQYLAGLSPHCGSWCWVSSVR